MDKLTIEQKKDILEGKGKVGGKYCNAIDEDLYNSDDWNNRMPVSSWCCYTEDDGRVSVCWEEVFACWDGWDSSDSEGEYFDTMEIAVNSIWTRQAVDKIFDFLNTLKHSTRILSEGAVIDVESSFESAYSTSHFRDDYDMNELLKNLRDNVYPLISGEYKA